MYLEVFTTQRAADEAQQDIKDPLLVTYFITASIVYPFLKHIQDPLPFNLVLQEKKRFESYTHSLNTSPQTDNNLKKGLSCANKHTKVISLTGRGKKLQIPETSTCYINIFSNLNQKSS